MKETKAVMIHELPKNSAFTFQQDSNRPKDIYWFKKMDGAYATIFSTKSDMDKFNKPAFVGSGTAVIPEVV